MVFSSLLFLFHFLPIVLIMYFLAPKKARNTLLFLSSLIFYAWGEPVYIVLMLFSTFVDYTLGYFVSYYISKQQRKKAKWCMITSAVINLSLLAFFKYWDFFMGSINSLFSLNLPLFHLALPIGISFYTFQTMSYTIDLYLGNATFQKNIISFGAYVSLFPQLIAGPIVQYKTIAEQLNKRTCTFEEFALGIHYFIIGLGKKVLLANNIGQVWTSISSLPKDQQSVATAWLGIICFAFQIYFDFSGYSDMAIGLGHMFGFRFLKNFDYPYISKSITEFWRRWHISLGTWFKEYVYIPLGGNKKGLKRQFINIGIVWFLTGFWHGASWNFVVWGMYFGVLLIMEKWFLLSFLKKFSNSYSHLYALFFILIGWVIFAFDSLSDGIHYLSYMFGTSSVPLFNTDFLYLLYNNAILLIMLCFASTPIPSNIANKLLPYHTTYVAKRTTLTRCIFYGIVFLLCVAYLVDSTYNPFLYFRF